MAEPTASIWEIARLILADPDADPSEIAQAHGVDIGEVAEMLPLLADNLRIDFAQAGSPGSELPLPARVPGESPEHFVERYLASVGGADGVHVESYATLGTSGDNGHAAATPEMFGTGRGDEPAAAPEPQVEQAPEQDQVVDDLFDALPPTYDAGPDLSETGTPDEWSGTDFQFD